MEKLDERVKEPYSTLGKRGWTLKSYLFLTLFIIIIYVH